MIHQLFDFIQCSPTASHTVATVRAMLLQEGFTQLLETDPWQLEARRQVLHHPGHELPHGFPGAQA